jgi:hypothetical protein
MAMNLPRLSLTQAARAELLRLMAFIHDYPPVVHVSWSWDGWFKRPDGTEGPLPDGWAVGFHDARKIPPDFLQIIDGISFALDGAKIWELDGRTLDFDGEKFRVNDIAI